MSKINDEIKSVTRGSNWVHHITNEFVTVLGVEGHMVDYQDNCGQKGRQGVEWFLSSYKMIECASMDIEVGSEWKSHADQLFRIIGFDGTTVSTNRISAKTGEILSFVPYNTLTFLSNFKPIEKDKSFAIAIIKGDYWEDVITHELVKIKDFKAQVVSYLEFDGLTHMHNEGAFRKYYKPKHLLSNLKK